MDPDNTGLISLTSDEKKTMNNHPKDSNFESYYLINHPQDQAEIKKEGPPVTQLFRSSNQKTSSKSKVQQSQEINFLPSPFGAPQDRALDQPLNDEMIQEQVRFEQARLKQASVIHAKARFQRSGFVRLEQWGSDKGTEMEIEEIEEERVHSENNDDPYADLFDNLSDKNEDSFIQAEEEKFDLEESEVFEGSSGSTQEPPLFQAINEMNEEKFDFNSLKSWNGDNEDQFLQCSEERIEKKPDLITNGFLKDSNGNNEYSFLQDIGDNMNAKFNLNVNVSFKLCGSLFEENSKWQQKSYHRPNDSNNDEIFFVVAEKFFKKDHTKA